jgi:hypothetical protein
MIKSTYDVKIGTHVKVGINKPYNIGVVVGKRLCCRYGTFLSCKFTELNNIECYHTFCITYKNRRKCQDIEYKYVCYGKEGIFIMRFVEDINVELEKNLFII